MLSRFLKHPYGRGVILLLVIAIGVSIFLLRANALPPSAGSVTIDQATSIGTSQFSPGITHVDDTLNYPWNNNDLTAVNHVKGLIQQAIPYENTAIMAWGAPDPWPDPTQAEPSDWSYLDQRLKLVNDTHGIPVLTLCEAPWWMKGILQSDGSTQVFTSAADEWSNDAYNARILDNKMDDWLHLVQRVAERYMAPPYNVRYFQVWNELKGYYNPSTKSYDYDNSPGDPSGPNAKHGYTYMYNQVYNRLMQVATSLNIPQSDVKVGGPYVPITTWASPNQSNLSHLVKKYGTYDQRYLDMIQYWLQNKVGAGFITVDGTNTNDDSVNLADPFTSAEKFADVVTWIRSLDNKTYPGAATLPIWWAEWYAKPYTTSSDDHFDAAVKAYAMIKLLKAGGAVALSWGGTGDGTTADVGLWTATTSGGGQPHSWYDVYRAFRDYFGPGTKIYRATVSQPKSVEALASATKVMLVNKTPKAISVDVNGQTVTLDPYQVSVVDY